MVGGGDEAWMSVLAILVAATYFRDESGGAIWAGGNWRYFGCEQNWEYMGVVGVSDDELKQLGLAFFLSLGLCRRCKLVIALRGTLDLNDLVADVKFVRELLHMSERFKRTQAVILEVVDDFLRQGGSTDDIYLAGHSLGAGVALLVGKHLVCARGIKVDTHLFNPPLLTAESIVTGKVFPWQKPGELTQWHKILGRIGNWMVTNFGNEKVLKEWEEFQRLHDWTPHLYVNSNDMISFQNIKFYKDRQHGRGTIANCISDLGILTRRFSGKYAKYIGSVVPSADLYINHQLQQDEHLINKYFNKKAHGVQQWLKLTETDVIVQFERVHARLLKLAAAHHIGYENHHVLGAVNHGPVPHGVEPHGSPLLAPQYPPPYAPQYAPQYGGHPYAGGPSFGFQYSGPQVAAPYGGPSFGPQGGHGGHHVVADIGRALRNAGHEVDRVVGDIGYGAIKSARDMLRRC